MKKQIGIHVPIFFILNIGVFVCAYFALKDFKRENITEVKTFSRSDNTTEVVCGVERGKNSWGPPPQPCMEVIVGLPSNPKCYGRICPPEG